MNAPTWQPVPDSTTVGRAALNPALNPQTGLADLIRSVAQDSVKLTAQGKRRLTRARNDMGLPDLASAVEICAALHEALVDYIDSDGAISIIHPITRLQTRIQLR